MSDAQRDRRPRVVVGADGSERSLRAVDWAAQEAAARGLPLVVCHVTQVTSWGGMAAAEERQQYADQLLGEVSARVAGTPGPTDVQELALTGQPAESLIAAATGAEMLVVGARGSGGFAALLLGSVSEQVATHAECPVVVVRGEHRSGPILVGVDGSPESNAALGFAFRRAAALDLPVRALHAYEMAVAVPSFGFVPSVGVEDVRGAAERVLEDAIQPWAERYPQVAVTRHLVDDRAAAALTRESVECGLLAVGSRGRGGFTGLLLGSVSLHALHHSECPVAVVRS
jgi:nucleotide-binding universal stress UspA family protein